MIQNLPFYVSAIFLFAAFLTMILFYIAANKSKQALGIIILWLIAQALLSLKGFYLVTNTIPPRFALMVIPPFLLIIILFVTKKGRFFIDGLKLKTLTLVHIVRIPVEIVLLLLFLHKQIPQVMTIEGRNFDIISGASAGLVTWLYFSRQQLNRKFLLLWNIGCLALVVNVVAYGVLSAPTVLQQLSFDQPNIAVLYFPFNWLPTFIVPVVIFSHLVAIRRLTKVESKKRTMASIPL